MYGIAFNRLVELIGSEVIAVALRMLHNHFHSQEPEHVARGFGREVEIVG